MNIFRTVVSLIAKKWDDISTIFLGVIAIGVLGLIWVFIIIEIVNAWPFTDPNNCRGHLDHLVSKPWVLGLYCFVSAILVGITNWFSLFIFGGLFLVLPLFGIFVTIAVGVCSFVGFTYLLGYKNPFEIKLKGIQRLSWYICLVIYSLFATCVWTMFLFEDFWLPMNFLFSFF